MFSPTGQFLFVVFTVLPLFIETAEEVKETSSEEEPHRVVHNVYRPVIQEVTEVIQPYRKVLQKVEPVIEEMKTIISKASPEGQAGAAPVQPQTSNYGGKSNSELVSIQSGDDGRFSRYGGNDLGRGDPSRTTRSH